MVSIAPTNPYKFSLEFMKDSTTILNQGISGEVLMSEHYYPIYINQSNIIELYANPYVTGMVTVERQTIARFKRKNGIHSDNWLMYRKPQTREESEFLVSQDIATGRGPSMIEEPITTYEILPKIRELLAGKQLVGGKRRRRSTRRHRSKRRGTRRH